MDNVCLFWDEAATADTRETARIVAEVLKAKNSKLIMVGDYRQHQAVGPGGAFAGLCLRLGKQELTEIIRQRHAEDREMVAAFRDKDTQRAIDWFVKREKIHVGEEVSDAQEHLVALRWANDETPQEHKRIIASTNLQVDCLNERCQRERAERGELGSDDLAVKIKDDFVARTGDRILLRRNYAMLDVANGDLGTVLSTDVSRGDIRLRLDKGGRIVTIPVAKYGKDKVTLGYASTSFLSQGASYESVYLFVHGGMTDAQTGYVMSSRHRESCYLVTTLDDAGERLTKLVRDFGRSREKVMAHDVVTSRSEPRKIEEQEHWLEHER